MNHLVHNRPWHLGAADDEGSQHALGNGRLLVYGRGPDLTQVWGPPYTSPNFLSLALAGPETLESVSSREHAGPIWRHQLRANGADAGLIVDVVDSSLPCMVRRVRAKAPLRFSLYLPNTLTGPDVAPSSRYPGTLSLVSVRPAGTPEYGDRFASVDPRSVQIVLSGKVNLEARPKADDWIVVCEPGESEILIAGGPTYPDCLVHAEAALSLGADAILERTRRHWASILAQITLPDTDSLDPAIREAAEDVALIIATQQAQEGGVVAGHNYPLAYVRDQYGVSRALLALGLHRRARAILDFYWDIFRREGVIHNAQSIGPYTRFHVHENDDVEMTGWFLIQAFDYSAATGDDAFLGEIAPMLEWCADAQERHLVEGMLPFNGDETYVAGGMLPRDALDDGSAEATLLYIESVRRFNKWCRGNGYGSSNALERRCQAVEETWQRYRANFFEGSRLMLNNPRRALVASRPRFRHGVCQRRLPDCRFVDWCELGADGRYACPVCFPHPLSTPRETRRYFLPSVATTPAFIGFSAANPEEHAAMLDAAMAPFTGEDGQFQLPETDLPGYEVGMLLHALAGVGDPRCPAMAKRLLELRDPTGAWSEYYAGAKGKGNRYRPWESAINLCGLLRASHLT